MSEREVDEITTITRKRIIYTCDRCGGEDTHFLQVCFICGRDVCDSCYIYLPDDRKMWHEYEHCCCKDCWDAGDVHIAVMNKTEESFRTMFESEIMMWKSEVAGGKYGK